ncbi:D-alanyl-D-alanine carboxypeptidase family protein [Cellulomonas soli]|uniref:D-alanyl-D-alanine carboxypeptidase family protein n=1 Tax=Cellulomonas soli TaxID=931535 RepID=UPI003F877479
MSLPAALLTALLGVVGLLGAAPARAAAGESDLGPGERLERGQALVSANGEHALVLQDDGLLSLFGAADVPRWTDGVRAPDGALQVREDGEVAVVSSGGTVVWSTGTAGVSGARLVVQDDGEVVVLDATGQVRWASGTAVRPSVLTAPAQLAPGAGLSSPDGRFTLDVLAEGDVRLHGPDGAVVWSTGTAVPGSVLVLQDDGNLVVREPDGARRWRTRTAQTPGAALVLRDDGALLLVDGTGLVVWDAGTAREPATWTAPGALPVGGGLTSTGGRTRLLVTDAGALELRHGTQGVWSTDPAGPGAVLTLDAAGVLALLAADGTTVWSAVPDPPAGSDITLSVEDDGALLRDGTGRELWRVAVPPEVLEAQDRLLGSPDGLLPDSCVDVRAPVPLDDTVLTAAGIRVHPCLADALDRLLAAAAADGVTLGGGGWRSGEQQRALRAAHCGSSPEQVETVPSWACTPPTAPPGLSRHEWGVAVDLTVGGRVLGADSAAFAWLSEHAAAYGLVNLPGEPWHWSVDGR